MNQERKQLLIDALKSGKYKKGKKRLCSTSNRFCCLGVASDIYMKETGLGMWMYNKNCQMDAGNNSFCDTTTTKVFCSPNQSNAAALTRDVEEWFGLTELQQGDLALINDRSGSFEPVIKALERM